MQSFRQRIYLILSSLLIAVLAVAWAKTRVVPAISDASRIVIAATNAESAQVYVADVNTLVIYRGKAVRSLSRVYHTPAAERVEYLTGPLRGSVSIRQGEDSVILRHDRPTLMTKATSSISQSYRLALLLRNYRAIRSEDSTIAGRLCDVVVLVPRQGGGQHTRKLWIDKRTHITLCNSDRVQKQRIISISSFTAVAYPKAIPGRLFSKPVTLGMRPVLAPMDCERLSRHLKFRVNLPRYLTNGYVFDGSGLYRCTCNCGHESAHLTFTDGMHTISVFETAGLASCGGKKCDLNGAMGTGDCAVKTGLQDGMALVDTKDRSIIVVGDTAGSELMRIARSVP